jgi:hypothetical protein
MRPNPAREVGCHADVERAVRAAGHDVDISALCHQISSHVAPAQAGAYPAFQCSASGACVNR